MSSPARPPRSKLDSVKIARPRVQWRFPLGPIKIAVMLRCRPVPPPPAPPPRAIFLPPGAVPGYICPCGNAFEPLTLRTEFEMLARSLAQVRQAWREAGVHAADHRRMHLQRVSQLRERMAECRAGSARSRREAWLLRMRFLLGMRLRIERISYCFPFCCPNVAGQARCQASPEAAGSTSPNDFMPAFRSTEFNSASLLISLMIAGSEDQSIEPKKSRFLSICQRK